MLRIGIIDDDPACIQTIEGHLSRYGREHNVKYTFAQFRSGLEFLSVYRGELDLLFLDVQMPGMVCLSCWQWCFWQHISAILFMQ